MTIFSEGNRFFRDGGMIYDRRLLMIYFCSEIWISEKRGAIAGIGHPSSCELYLVLGNKKVRVGRIVGWEKEHDQTYPRLRFRVTKSLSQLKKWRWVKAGEQDRLIPYKCYDNLQKINV